ncbi:M14 family zinc carboxypeptidase [Streptomyces cavernicola]|uniref:M14 family zinc carboxypeptidase n=1 Tax=Streptomyces cavernicola TaxID=3043613 RepID=A0ABT6S978_9ACTN|nr:M14 family zinc carboxypeptidase [Streptomyces sp. B-S-A6]MDI3404653.1 M14 family zinc carboxypeptidase [Streptomyces sp. B-S-A6]
MSARRWIATLASTALIAGLSTAAAHAGDGAIPPWAHCGTEASGSGSEGFVDHAQLTSALKQLEASTGGLVDVEVAGYSQQGRAIHTARVGEGDKVVYVQTQIHGNEMHGTEAALELLKRWGSDSPAAQELRKNVTVVVVPRLNADGGELDRRQNDMSWGEVVADFPQLADASPAWNYNARVGGFDVNRDFNPNLDYVPAAADFPGSSADTGWYITPEAQTSRDVYRSLEREFGTVDFFVDLHNQWSCYATDDMESMSPLSISAKFIDDPAAFGDWPKFDMVASKRANVAVYQALQEQGDSSFGDLTLYPQSTNLPGTALGSYQLRGSAAILFETSSQTQYDGMKRNGMLTQMVETGLGGLVDAVADGSVDSLDAGVYDSIPERVTLPSDGPGV